MIFPCCKVSVVSTLQKYRRVKFCCICFLKVLWQSVTFGEKQVDAVSLSLTLHISGGVGTRALLAARHPHSSHHTIKPYLTETPPVCFSNGCTSLENFISLHSHRSTVDSSEHLQKFTAYFTASDPVLPHRPLPSSLTFQKKKSVFFNH